MIGGCGKFVDGWLCSGVVNDWRRMDEVGAEQKREFEGSGGVCS